MKMYEIRLSGNVPVSIHGLYHKSGTDSNEAKTKLAREIQRRLIRKDITIGKLVKNMKAIEI